MDSFPGAKISTRRIHQIAVCVQLTEGVEGAAVFFGEGGGGEEVGPVSEGLFEGLGASPLAHGLVVAVLQDFGDLVAEKVGRAGVVGVVEEAAGGVGGGGRGAGSVAGRRAVVTEALETGGVRVAEDAGEEAGDGVDEDGGGELAAGEDVVSDGDLAVAEQGVDALVDALVAAAEQDDALGGGELVGDGLGIGASLGGEEDDGGFGAAALGAWGELQGVEGVEDGAGLEDHAFATAEGAVVDGAVAVVGEGSEVVQVDAGGTGGEGSGEDAVAQEAFEEAGKDGEDVEAHGELAQENDTGEDDAMGNVTGARYPGEYVAGEGWVRLCRVK